MKSPALLQRGIALSLVIGLAMPGVAFAESLAVNTPAVSQVQVVDGYSMMNWLGSLGIVEQLQTIHRLSQSASPDAIQGLIAALNSPFPLARRKASRSLLERSRMAEPDEQRAIVEQLNPSLETKDPIVQKNIVRLIADLKIPEAHDMLRRFFQGADKQAQLNAVDALSQDTSINRDTLSRLTQASPYTEVRQASVLHLE